MRSAVIKTIGGLFIAALALHSAGAEPAGVYLEDLTWTELRDRIQSGDTAIIVPIGGTEQSGPDMALGKHNVRVRSLAGKVAAALGHTLVAPVIAYVPEGGVNPPTGHMRFPGTITIPDRTFEQLLESAGDSFRLAGFKDVFFLGDHGGYQAELSTVARHLNQAWSATPSVRAHAVLEYYRATETTYVQALKARGFDAREIGTHAGLADTSLMLAVNPALVRSDRLAGGAGLDAADGVYGDPRRSSAELGQLGVDAIVSETVAAMRKEMTGK